MLDIDRLHAIEMGQQTGRRAGRTTAMLVEAAQLADFSAGTVLIVASSCDRAQYLADEFWKIAEELGFAPVRNQRQLVTIGVKEYRFVTTEMKTEGMHLEREFRDWDMDWR